MSNSSLTLGLAQHAMTENTHGNLATSLEMVAEAASQGAKLVVLPELHRSLYFCKSQQARFFDLAEPLKGPTFDALSEMARKVGVVIVGSIFERRQAGLTSNTAIVIDSNGALAGHYRKMHIPDDPGYNEKYYFSPGDTGFCPVQTSVGHLGVLVCWDQWFPEAARLMALAGAEVLIYPTAIGWDPQDESAEQTRQLNAWRLMHQAHGVANGLHVVACNRVGFETDPDGDRYPAKFWGHSLIAGPQGEILAEADDAACVLVRNIDLSRSETVRRQWPFLRDRRIDAYQGLLSRSLVETE